MLPLECRYLNKSALTTLAGPLTPPVKHFQLKRKPKSATLRAELLQKCECPAAPGLPVAYSEVPLGFPPSAGFPSASAGSCWGFRNLTAAPHCVLRPLSETGTPVEASALAAAEMTGCRGPRARDGASRLALLLPLRALGCRWRAGR